MFTVKIDGIEAVHRKIQEAGKQARYAAAVSLTRTAKDVEKRLQSDMASSFDNPAPWVAKGTFVKPADKQTLTATVGIKDRQALYVKEFFNAGGARGAKPFEKALASMGVLPNGYRAVPGDGLKLDARGIPNRAQLREVFGSLASRMQVAKGRGKRMQLVGYFVIPVGTGSRLHPGVWWRSGRATKPVLLFVRGASYRKLFDLARTAQDVVASDFDRHFAEAFENALRTAR